MVLSQARSNRKPSGGRYKNTQSKKLTEKGREPMFTRLADKKTRTVKGRGSTSKIKALSITELNVYDPAKKAYTKTQMTSVFESGANRNYVRRNIITKGTIVVTPLGNARITNRPSQEGCVNGILIQ